MARKARSSKVDEVLKKETKWREEFEQLRPIALECPLTEEVKWSWPCYTHQQTENVQAQRQARFVSRRYPKTVISPRSPA